MQTLHLSDVNGVKWARLLAAEKMKSKEVHHTTKLEIDNTVIRTMGNRHASPELSRDPASAVLPSSLAMLLCELDTDYAIPAWLPMSPDTESTREAREDAKAVDWFAQDWGDGATKKELKEWFFHLRNKPGWASRHRMRYAEWVKDARYVDPMAPKPWGAGFAAHWFLPEARMQRCSSDESRWMEGG